MDADEQKPERGKSQHWLELIEDAENKLSDWQTAADNIDTAYADLADLRSDIRDRDFQLFWSNIQVMGPSIYARPPVPVVTPKFKDRRPLYRTASEMLERACSISFDMADIDTHMIAMRDDLAIVGRGASWVRYESDDDGERVCYEHVDRKDFLHEPARKWGEVDWVARRAWLSHDEMQKRFGDAASPASYSTSDGENPGTSIAQKCGVWEIWCKSENKVVWVVEGTEENLDEADPHLNLVGFFPCPRPAYATVQRRTLIPIPDMLLYKDQLEEVRTLTRRIHTLAEAIKVRGFYNSGTDVGKALESAIQLTDDSQILIPVPAMAALMQGGGDPIIWLPLDMVAKTITGLIELRRQVIDDVYQIIGLSDIMRGSTVASETLGAQQLKQQNGSYRVRDKQNELVRMARDLVRIGAEIMAEHFERETLEDMAQMDLPTSAEQKAKLESLEASAEAELKELMGEAEEMATQAQQSGEQVDPAQAAQQSGEQVDPAQAAQQSGEQVDPAQAAQQFEQQQQAIIGKWTAEIQKCQDEITIDAVMEFLGDEKLRPFALDIETDSTIYPDEMAEKASRQEFMVAFSGTMQSLMPLFQLGPEAVAVASGIAKFALSPYRVGRELEGLIDDFADKGPEMAERMQAAQGSEPDEGLAAAQMEIAKAEMAKVQSQTEANQATAQLRAQELQLKSSEAQAKTQQDQQKFQLEVEKTRGSIAETEARIEKVYADIKKMGFDAEVTTHDQKRQDAKFIADQQGKQQDQQRADIHREQDRSDAAEDRHSAAVKAAQTPQTQLKGKPNG